MKKITWGGLRALRLRNPFYRAMPVDPDNPLLGLTGRELAEVMALRIGDAAARISILTGDQEPPRGFGVATLKGSRLRLAKAARDSLNASLEGVREVYRRSG